MPDVAHFDFNFVVFEWLIAFRRYFDREFAVFDGFERVFARCIGFRGFGEFDDCDARAFNWFGVCRVSNFAL